MSRIKNCLSQNFVNILALLCFLTSIVTATSFAFAESIDVAVVIFVLLATLWLIAILTIITLFVLCRKNIKKENREDETV